MQSDKQSQLRGLLNVGKVAANVVHCLAVKKCICSGTVNLAI